MSPKSTAETTLEDLRTMILATINEAEVAMDAAYRESNPTAYKVAARLRGQLKTALRVTEEQ